MSVQDRDNGKVEIHVKKYSFTPWETESFILQVLRKEVDELQYVERELALKFIQNEELFDSWLTSLYINKNDTATVIEAQINLNGCVHTLKVFKERKQFSGYLYLPIPYIAKLNKVIVLGNTFESGEPIKDNAVIARYDVSGLDYYVFFNPIKILKDFYALLIVTDKGTDIMFLNDIKRLEQQSEGIAKSTKSTRKRSKSKKGRSKRKS
jgi:hypothetical protein